MVVFSIVQRLQKKTLTIIEGYNRITIMTKTHPERTEERKNRFNGESVMLTKEEAKKHDEIFMHELTATLEDKTLGTGGSKHWQHMRDKLSWFMKHNAKAYMVLLD